MQSPQTHRFPVQLRLNDIDLVGHVNNVIFGHYCDAARYDFMQTRLPVRIDLQHDSRILILVHTEFDFLVPCFIDSVLFVETKVEKVGNRSLSLVQEIVDDNGVVHVRSHSVMSTFDKTTGKSFELPPAWRPLP